MSEPAEMGGGASSEGAAVGCGDPLVGGGRRLREPTWDCGLLS